MGNIVSRSRKGPFGVPKGSEEEKLMYYRALVSLDMSTRCVLMHPGSKRDAIENEIARVDNTKTMQELRDVVDSTTTYSKIQECAKFVLNQPMDRSKLSVLANMTFTPI